jgi:hypothetical protein
MAATNVIAHWQGANHVSYPGEPANDDRSFSMANALENQPHDPADESYPRFTPFADSPLKTEKPAPPRPQCGMHWTRQD